MGNETNIDGKWLFTKLKMCLAFNIVERLYNDWVRTNTSLVGFKCEMKGEKNQEKFDKIYEFIKNHKLPLYIEDYPSHNKLFKIKIEK
jgi:hypothetical protein